MNVRLSSGNLRFRVTTDEMARLREDGFLVEVVAFPGGKTIVLEICAPLEAGEEAGGDGPLLALAAGSDRIALTASRKALERLATPSKGGVGAERIVKGKTFKYSLEVDIRT